jgi:hypothetical protein
LSVLLWTGPYLNREAFATNYGSVDDYKSRNENTIPKKNQKFAENEAI